VKAVKKAVEDFFSRSDWQQPNVAEQVGKIMLFPSAIKVL
jgi:hypothetical protein